MMDTLILFSVGFIVYTYFGYPVLLWVWSLFMKREHLHENYTPSVTVLFAACNEEACIGETLDSILSSDYPDKLLDVIVVSDGSTDQTDKILSGYPPNRVRLVSLTERQGKPKALSLVYPQAKGEILLLIDASSFLPKDTIRRLVRHFQNPKVGSVGGAKVIRQSGGSVSQGDGLYWKYDVMLRTLESQTGASWSGCEGGLYAIRKGLFKLDYSTALANDYAVCCRVLEQGFQHRIDPSAVMLETASKTMEIELSRKIRVIVRGLRAFFAFGYLLNPLKNPRFFVQTVSHKLFRWSVPFFLIFIFFGCGISSNPFFKSLFYLQAIFYGIALLALVFEKINRKLRLGSVPLYFTVVNAAALLSWFLIFKNYALWTPTIREKCPVAIREGN